MLAQKLMKEQILPREIRAASFGLLLKVAKFNFRDYRLRVNKDAAECLLSDVPCDVLVIRTYHCS